MSDHLPECFCSTRSKWSSPTCICDRLRQAEQRVYLWGLTAARDAVAAAFPSDQATYRWQALAAIDALRGES